MTPIAVLRMRPPTQPTGKATVTALGQAGSTAAGGFGIAVNVQPSQLLVVLCTFTLSNTDWTAINISDTLGGTYTEAGTCSRSSGATMLRMYVRDTLIATSGSITVTANASAGNTTGGFVAVLAISNRSVQTAGLAAVKVGGIQSEGAGGTTPAPALGGIPNVANPIIAAVNTNANAVAVTPRAGYTENYELSYNTPGTTFEVMSRNSGESSQTITWGASLANAYCAIAQEFYS